MWQFLDLELLDLRYGILLSPVNVQNSNWVFGLGTLLYLQYTLPCIIFKTFRDREEKRRKVLIRRKNTFHCALE
jgi:hypothetical protein